MNERGTQQAQLLENSWITRDLVITGDCHELSLLGGFESVGCYPSDACFEISKTRMGHIFGMDLPI